MIPEFLHKNLFGQKRPLECHFNSNLIIDQLKKTIKNIEFKINDKDTAIKQPWERLEKYLPKLENNDVISHLNSLGKYYSEPYYKKVEKLLEIPESLLENKPKQWIFQQGWICYKLDLKTNKYKYSTVDFPLEDSLIFDVEVCLEESNKKRPTIAVALSPKAWYSWCSEALLNVNNQSYLINDISLDDLIPMGKFSNERLIVGHNVSFDRSYIKEQYLIDPDRTRFLDTMSLHICVSGLNQEQKIFAIRNGNPWDTISSLNNLSDVYKLYCKSTIGLEKDPRDIFVKGTLMDVYENFSFLTNYCATDVAATLKILKSLFPQFIARCPSPITFSGILEMSTMYLPVNKNTWKRYINESNSIYHQYKNEINETLKEIACETCSYLKGDHFTKDPWLWDLDWKTRSLAFKKSLPKHSYENLEKNELIKELYGTAKHLKKNQPILPGYPQWFVELCENTKLINKIDSIDFNDLFNFDQFTITTRLRSIPKLLKLMWNEFPLYFDQTYGWGYLVPFTTIENCESNFPPLNMMKTFIDNNKIDKINIESGINDIIPGCTFFKLPHKNGPNKRVGNPLSKVN